METKYIFIEKDYVSENLLCGLAYHVGFDWQSQANLQAREQAKYLIFYTETKRLVWSPVLLGNNENRQKTVSLLNFLDLVISAYKKEKLKVPKRFIGIETLRLSHDYRKKLNDLVPFPELINNGWLLLFDRGTHILFFPTMVITWETPIDLYTDQSDFYNAVEEVMKQNQTKDITLIGIRPEKISKQINEKLETLIGLPEIITGERSIIVYDDKTKKLVSKTDVMGIVNLFEIDTEFYEAVKILLKEPTSIPEGATRYIAVRVSDLRYSLDDTLLNGYGIDKNSDLYKNKLGFYLYDIVTDKLVLSEGFPKSGTLVCSDDLIFMNNIALARRSKVDLKQGKFTISKTDGTPIEDGADYIVLRIDVKSKWAELVRRTIREKIFDIAEIDKEFAHYLFKKIT